MKNLTYILIILLSTSCLTTKKIERNCAEFVKICEVPIKTEVMVIEATKTEIVYKDTIVYIELPGKEIIKEVPVYIHEGLVNSDPVIMETDLCKSTSQVRDSELIAELMQKDTTIQQELDNALKTIRVLNTEKWKTETENTITITENSNFANFTIKVFWGLIVVVVLGVGYMIFKFKSKFL